MNALDALWRCQRAWERSQPQLFMELYPDGLDEPHRSAVRFVEPAAIPQSLPGGGLAAGAEPCCDNGGLTAGIPSSPDPDSSFAALAAPTAGSAPLSTTTGPDAPPAKGTRPAQEVTL